MKHSSYRARWWQMVVPALVAVLAALLCIPSQNASAASANDASKDSPNVLFLICDDLNCDLGSYGHPMVKSPNIDRLAERGVRFERAYCQYPLCGPSRASFMTGLYPDQTLVRRNAIYIRQHLPDVTTIPQMFRRAGYVATRVGKIFHYNVPKHIGTGGHDDPYSWDFTFNPRGRDVEDEPLIFSLRPGSFGGTLSWLAAGGDDLEQTDGIGASHAVRLLKQYAEHDRRFFLAVGLYRPHTPYVAPKRYFDLYPADEMVVPEIPADYLDTLPAPARTSITRKREQVHLREDLARQAIQAYYASITFADAQLGRILNTLRETGLEEQTIIVFTSDHGYHMGQHGHWQKTTLFENAARVPLVIAGPGVTRLGQTVTTPVEMVDFYPTLAELCGLAAPDYVAGSSLVPALNGSGELFRKGGLTQYANGYSLRTARYRYTEWGDQGAEGAELYDHRSDPQEMVNLAGRPEHAELAQRLSRRLQQRLFLSRRAPEGLKQLE